MTFEELDQRFPNGLDDAEITKLTIDYGNRNTTVQLNMRGNSPDRPDSEKYRLAMLTLHQFYYLSIEPPDSDHLFYPERTKITVDGLSEDSGAFPLFGQLKSNLPAGAFCCRFYVHDWNSFIHIAAREAQFSWEDEKG